MIGGEENSDEIKNVKRLLSRLYPKVLESKRPLFYSSTDFVVANARGGIVEMSDTDLSVWCIDSIRLLRNQVDNIVQVEKSTTHPTAKCNNTQCSIEVNRDGNDDCTTDQTVCDDSLVASIQIVESFATEVVTLLDILAEMYNDRKEQLRNLRPPTRLSRNWYVIVLGLPLASYTIYTVIKEQMNSKLLPEIFNKVVLFCEEHIFDPMRSM